MPNTWDLYSELDDLRREFDRIFNGAGWGRRPGAFFRFPFLPGESARSYPLLNISEDEQNFYVAALAPGLNPDSLSINTVQNQLTITGEKASAGNGVKPEAFHRNERAAGRFVRSVTLPSEVESEKAEAHFANGIINITLPKSEAAKPKQIEVKVG